jgi:hypothetical protein
VHGISWRIVPRILPNQGGYVDAVERICRAGDVEICFEVDAVVMHAGGYNVVNLVTIFVDCRFAVLCFVFAQGLQREIVCKDEARGLDLDFYSPIEIEELYVSR